MKIWRDKEVVQNALQLSAAIYKTEPHQYIRNRKNTMTISEIVAIGDLNVNDERQSCIFALESCKNTSSKMTTLYIAMKGSETSKDWKTNLDFEMVENEYFLGKFHRGFFNRSVLADLEDIQNMIVKYSVQRVITCGHSMGGAVSSILHLRLAKYFDDIIKLPIKLVNLTFGAPFFGNDRLCQHVAGKWTYKQMFHFVAVEDIVPSLLSLGNTIQYLNDAVNNVLPLPLTKFVQSNLGSIQTLVFLTVGLTEVLTQKGSQETRNKIKQFAASMRQLMISSEASTLFNEYNEHQYVPIGQFLLLLKRQSKYQIEHQAGDPKVIEQLLIRIEEQIARSPSMVLDVKTEHSMEKYINKIKEAFDGFVTIPHQPVIFAKMNFDWIRKEQFSFKAPWQLVCGFNGCEECDVRIPLYNQDWSLLKKGVECCLTCHHDTTNPHVIEIYFHKKCWIRFHQGEKSQHIKRSIPSDLLKAEGQDLKELFDLAKNVNIVALYDPKRRQRLMKKLCPDKSLESWATNGVKLVIQLVHLECIAARVEVPYFAKNVIPFLGKTKTIGIGASIATSGVMFVASTGYFFCQWMQNKITGTDFARKTLIEFVSTGASIGMEALVIGGAAAAGVALAATPIGWVVLGLSVIGAIGGYVGTKKALEYFFKKWGILQNATKEEEDKADQVAQAIVFLNLYEPDIKRLEVEQIQRQYRKMLMQNLHWHQDRFPKDAPDEDKLVAKLCFDSLNMSKDILITVCEQPELFSDKMRGLIKDRVSKMDRTTIEEFVKKERGLHMPIVKNALPIELNPSYSNN